MIDLSKHVKKLTGVKPAHYAVSKSGNPDLPPDEIIVGRKNLNLWLKANEKELESLSAKNFNYKKLTPKATYLRIKVPDGADKKALKGALIGFIKSEHLFVPA